jgi:hypothetical protein
MTHKSPWAHDAPAEPICLPDRSDEPPIEMSVDPDVLPTGHLAIGAGMSNPPVPLGVAVMVDGQIVATLTVEEVKDAAKLIDQMEVAAEHPTIAI